MHDLRARCNAAGLEEGHRAAQRAGAPMLQEQAEGAALRDLIVAFQHPKGAYRWEGDRLLTGTWSDRTRGNGFKLKGEI